MEEPFAAAEIRRLEGLRVQAAELAIDADLAAGFHHEVVAEIERLVGEHPLRERLHAQRMLALYRCGRQAEALEAYREARRILVDAVGLEPGAELQRLQDAILRQDPSLDVEPPVAELPRELAHAGATPIVGRDGELAWLRARWARALGGKGGLVAVTGEDGIGKTRLAAELAAEVHDAGGSVLYASGWARPEAGRGRAAPSAPGAGPDAARRRRCRGGPGCGRRSGRGWRPSCRASRSWCWRRPATAIGGGVAESLALPPLDRTAVHRIAQLYAPARRRPGRRAPGSQPRSSPAGFTSWRASGRCRRRRDAWRPSHRARRPAGVSCARPSTSWPGAWSLCRSRASVSTGSTTAGAVVCPFKGLASFDVADAPYFFGRERLVAELVARAVGAPLLGVVGPSGSGKSSVVKAGLLASLTAGVLPGSADWPQVVIRPGERPMRELRAVEGRSTVLAVDQFEEIFTACRDESERAAFVDALVDRAAGRRRPGGRRRCEPTSTGAARRIPGCRGCSAPTRCWWAR